jgi:hypothetical protein
MVAGLHNDSFPHHVPELLLRYPIFLIVVAYDQGSFFDFHILPTVSEFVCEDATFCVSTRVQFVSTKLIYSGLRLIEEAACLRARYRYRDRQGAESSFI